MFMKFPLLDSMADAEVEALIRSLPQKTYSDEALIFETGDESCDVYLILQGGTKSFVYAENGKAAYFRMRQAGDIFGYYSALTGGLRTANMMAVGETKLAVMRKEMFLDLVTYHPELSRKMMTLLAGLLREETQRISGMVTMTAKQQVCNILRIMRDSQNALIVHTPSRDEMASFAGITRETLSRILNELKTEGVITIDKATIQILDEQALLG